MGVKGEGKIFFLLIKKKVFPSPLKKSVFESFGDGVIDFEVCGDGLNVIEVFESFDEAEDLFGNIDVGDIDGGEGAADDTGFFGFDTCFFEGVSDGFKSGGVAPDFSNAVFDDEVFSACIEDDIHKFFFVCVFAGDYEVGLAGEET